MQDVPPVQGPVRRALYLGVQEVREAERVHHDQRLRESALQSTAGESCPAAGRGRGGGVSAPPTPPSTQETPLSAAHGGAAQRAVAPQLSGHRRASPASRLGLRRDTHAQRAGGAGVLPAPPRWRSRTCRTRRCPEAPRGRSPLRKTAARKHRARPAGPAGGGGWARGLLPPEQLRGMFELRLGSRKPRPQFSWTLAVSGGQGYGDHTLR